MKAFSDKYLGLWQCLWKGLLAFFLLFQIPAEAAGTCGNKWTLRHPAQYVDRHVDTYLNTLNGVAWNGQRFVAVGDKILTSPDGLAWTSAPLVPGNGVLNDIAWNGSQFVAVGYDKILTSPDGLVWTGRALPAPLYPYESPYLGAIIWNGAQFVTVGAIKILTSPDGVAWTRRDSRLVPDQGGIAYVDEFLRGIAWGGSQFVAVGEDYFERSGGYFGYNGLIATSPDGTAWTPHHRRKLASLYSIAWNGSRFVAVGFKGMIVTSRDGVKWTRRKSGTTVNLSKVIWSDGRFLVIGAKGTILTSRNGTTWSRRRSGAPAYIGLQGAASGNGQWVAVGGGETILTSPCQSP